MTFRWGDLYLNNSKRSVQGRISLVSTEFVLGVMNIEDITLSDDQLIVFFQT